MLTTGCDGCCFISRDDKGVGCKLGHMSCVDNNGNVFTPGYCRMCRSNAWAKKHGTDDVSVLRDNANSENKLTLDCLIIFDERFNTKAELCRSVDSVSNKLEVAKIIIVDVTGSGNRNNVALQVIKGYSGIAKIVVDSSIEHETVCDRESTIRRISRQVSSGFFLVIHAGDVVNYIDRLSKIVDNSNSRVIHWSIPMKIGMTTIAPIQLRYGLFLTKPYRALVGGPNEMAFTERLRKEENETSMALTWFCGDLAEYV